jgi:hypothetical protein
MQLYFNEHHTYPAVADLQTELVGGDYLKDLPDNMNCTTSATDFECTVPVDKVVPEDVESEERCTGAVTNTMGQSGHFYICSD